MDVPRILILLLGVFLLAYGLAAYRYFYHILGATTGLVIGIALRKTMLKLPGLSENPGVASFLIFLLFILLGMFIATRFRRLLAFLAGLGTGAILYRGIASLWTGSELTVQVFPSESLGLMELLAGMVTGVFFLLFEGVFALILTSAVGAALCAHALGGRWTFPVCLALGLVAQPLISRRIVPETGPGSGKTRGKTTIIVAVLMVLLPTQVSLAAWEISRVNKSSARVIFDGGKRHGVRAGEEYAVVNGRDDLLAVITVSEVYTDEAYSEALPAEEVERIRTGDRVLTLEDYEYSRLRSSPSVEGHLDFLSRYPESRYRPEIEETVDRIRYGKALSRDTVTAYREFRRQYPGSRHAADALAREEELSFQRAAEEGTEEGYSKFLRDYPGTERLSGMMEVRLFLRTRSEDRVYAYQEFLAKYPRSGLADQCLERIREFERWAHELEFGQKRIEAIRFFGRYGDPTAVPQLVGKLADPELGPEARKAILAIGEPAVKLLMEVLISPLQSVDLKDRAASILGELGEVYAVPALRTYVRENATEAGRAALDALEEKHN